MILRAGIAFFLLLSSAEGLLWDEGIHSRCAWTRYPDKPNFYADTTDCPSIDAGAVDRSLWPPHWWLGINSPAPNHTQCGPRGQNYLINGRRSPLHLGWQGDTTRGYEIQMGIVRSPCDPGAEISYDIGANNLYDLIGLHTHNEIALRRMARVAHVNMSCYFQSPVNGTQHDLTLLLAPISSDPRYNYKTPGILYAGSPVRHHHQIVLDARRFGFPTLCPYGVCGGFVEIDVNWEKLLQRVRELGYWRDIDATRVHCWLTVGLQTFGNGRVKITHRAWRAYNQTNE